MSSWELNVKDCFTSGTDSDKKVSCKTTPWVPTSTPQVPTSTPQVPTSTPQVPTSTPQVPKSTALVPTSTAQVPTSTSQENFSILYKCLSCSKMYSKSTPPIPACTSKVPLSTPSVQTSAYQVTARTPWSLQKPVLLSKCPSCLKVIYTPQVPTRTPQVQTSISQVHTSKLPEFTSTLLTPTCTSEESMNMNTFHSPINTEHLKEQSKLMTHNLPQPPQGQESASQAPSQSPKRSSSHISMNTFHSLNENLEPDPLDPQEESMTIIENTMELDALNPEYKLPKGQPLLLYKCPLCPHVFPTKHYFTQHLETHPTPTHSDNVDEILLAKTVSFEGEIFSVCPLCHVLCAPNEGIMKHLQAHDDNKYVQDDEVHSGLAQQPIETEGNVSREEPKAAFIKQCVQQKCGSMFLPSLRIMVTKVNNSKGHNICLHHDGEKKSTIPMKPIESFKCAFCQKACLTDRLLQLHLKTIHGQNPSQMHYMCANCPGTFQSTSALNHHSKHCFKKLKFECLHCYCAFMLKTDLIKHIKKNHLWCQCVKCKKVFQSEQALTEHNSKEHPNIKDRALIDDSGILWIDREYICIDCRAVFSQKEQMENHLLTCSTANGGVRCEEDDCRAHSVKLKCMCSLLKHIRKNHMRKYMNGSAKENKAIAVALDFNSSNSSPQCCGICGIMCASREDLAKHVVSVHSVNQEAEYLDPMNEHDSYEIEHQAGYLGKTSDVMTSVMETQQGIEIKSNMTTDQEPTVQKPSQQPQITNAHSVLLKKNLTGVEANTVIKQEPTGSGYNVSIQELTKTYSNVSAEGQMDIELNVSTQHSRQTDKELESSFQTQDNGDVNNTSSHSSSQKDGIYANHKNHGTNGSEDHHQDGIAPSLSNGVMPKQNPIEIDPNIIVQQQAIASEIQKLNFSREEPVVTALRAEHTDKAEVNVSPVYSLKTTVEEDLMHPTLGGTVKGHDCNTKKSKKKAELHIKAMHSSVSAFRKVPPKHVSGCHVCLHCQKTFQNEAYFQTHSLLCSRNARNASYQCVHCDSKITRRSQLILHIRRNHLWMPCGKCGEVYQSTQELAEHELKEHSKTETVCGITWSDADQRPLADQEYVCVDCQKVFYHRKQIENHLLTKCDVKVRIVRCRKCNARFKCRCSLLQHRRRYHSGYNTSTSKYNPSFYNTPQHCGTCGQLCPSGNDLVKHIVSVHSRRLDKDGDPSRQVQEKDCVNDTLSHLGNQEIESCGNQVTWNYGNQETGNDGNQETGNYGNQEDDHDAVVRNESITGESVEMPIIDVRTLSDTFNGLFESETVMPRQEPAELQSNVVLKQKVIDSELNLPIRDLLEAGVKEQNMVGKNAHKEVTVCGTCPSSDCTCVSDVNSITQSARLYRVEKLHSNSPFVRSYNGRPTKRYNMIHEAKQCPLCHKSFSRRYLGKHIREKCDKAFLRKHIMKEHSYAKRREQSYAKRKIPNLEASLPDWLTDNTESSETSMFRCALCNRLCVSHKSLGRHMRKVHVRQECYKCPNCAKVFTMRESLRQHRRVHSTNRSLSIIQRVRNAQLLKMANRKKVRCRGYLSMIKKLWKRNRKIYYYNRKRSTTIKRCTILRAYSRCLMCLKWYRGIEQHLWKCQAKRPCLKRIIEIYTEIKQEPKDEYEEALVDHKQPVEGDQFVSSNYVQPLVALQGHTEEPLELKLELENDQPSKLEQPFRTGEQPLEAGEPPNLSLEEGPEDDDPPLLTPEEHDVKSDQLLQTSVPPVLAHEQPFTTLEQTFKIEEPPTLVRKQPEYTHEQSDQPILAYKQAKVEMKLESEEELIEEQEELVEPNLEVQDVMDSKAYRKCMMCLHWVCEIEDHLWVCQAKRQCLTRISIVEVKSKIKEVPIKPQQELVEKVELTKPLESVLDSQSLMNEVDKKVHAKCLLCLIQLSEVELANHLWTCEAKRPCLNKVTISTV